MTQQDAATVEVEVAGALPYSPQSLLEAARRFARSAIASYSPAEAPFFFLHAGASTELLLKSALCFASPALLLDRQFTDEALIRLVGLQPAQSGSAKSGRKRVERPPFTVAFSKAIERYLLLHGPEALGVAPDDLDLIKAARDLAAHGPSSGHVTGEMHAVLITFIKVVGSVLPKLNSTPRDFWGDNLPFTERALEEQRGEAASLMRTLVSAARRRFDAKYAGVPRESLDRMMSEVFWDANPKPNEWSRKCPACGAQGIAQVRPELGREVSRGRLRLVPGYKAVDFRCLVCQLTVEDEELIDAAEDFDAWEPEESDLEFWAEDYGMERLTEDEIRELGIDSFADESPPQH